MKTPFHLVLYKAYSAQRSNIRPYMATIGLSPGQPKILSTLLMRGPCLQKELAEACAIEPATVSKLLNNMEAEGMIERHIVAGNKRAVEIRITEKGEALKRHFMQHCDQMESAALAGFTDKEAQLFADFLCRMYRNLTGKEIE